MHGFFDVPPAHGVPSVSYDLAGPSNLLTGPIGFDDDPPIVPLLERPTTIAGHRIDFPLGLPASVLAANAKWIEFYARRGFSILTYKTVRTRFRVGNEWPNWVFLRNPVELEPPFKVSVVGYPGYWPEDLRTVSMANSFGIPSLDPEWWVNDVRRARQVIRQGHEVLIVSIVASVDDSLDAMTDDFVEAARLAKKAGADIVEANFSCPNAPDEKGIGELYQNPGRAGRVSQALRDELGSTPLFVKIGYLPPGALYEFVTLNADHIRGIVAINTIAAPVVDAAGEPTFAGRGRERPGVSGWAIQARAHEVASNLVGLKKELRRDFAILSVGGVLTKQDFETRLATGVDAVQSATGAFLNPYLGLDIRLDAEAAAKRPTRLAFELEILGKLLGDVLFRPMKSSRFRVDTQNRRVSVDPILTDRR
jgi:dihydroorotate dehydrogenase (NAD+) catalytic subunit